MLEVSRNDFFRRIGPPGAKVQTYRDSVLSCCGFTIIELMLVIAIIGVLTAIAYPVVKDYATRAKVSECVGLLTEYKTRLSDYVAANSGLPPAGESCVAFECVGVDRTTKYCGAVTTVNDTIDMVIKPETGIKSACYIRLRAYVLGSSIQGWEGQTSCSFDVVPATFRNPPSS